LGILKLQVTFGTELSSEKFLGQLCIVAPHILITGFSLVIDEQSVPGHTRQLSG
jgi:hypothetical protein